MSSLTPTSTHAIASDRINASDHGAFIIITAGIVFGVTIMALCLRLFQRWPWSRLLKTEDYALILATLLETGNTAAIAASVHAGLGRRPELLTEREIRDTTQSLIASFALTFLTEGLSSCSFLWLLRSMNPNKAYRRVLAVLGGFILAWTIAGIARMVVAGVGGSELLKSTWIAFGVISIAIQVSLTGSSFWTIWTLQMPIKRKAGLSLWFSLSLLVVAVISIRLAHTPERTLTGGFTWLDINMVIISLIESNLTIINAAYPSVRAFLNQVSTGFIVAETGTGSKSRSGKRSQGYALQSIGGGRLGTIVRSKDAGLSFSDRRSAHHSTAVKGDMKSDRSFGSEVIMVRHSVEIDEASISGSHLADT